MHQAVINHMAMCESTNNYDRYLYNRLKREMVKKYGNIDVPKINERSRAQAFLSLLILAGIFGSNQLNKQLKTSSFAVYHYNQYRGAIEAEIRTIKKELINEIKAVA